MAVYGYKICGFARTERYNEAVKYLDKRLKDYEKQGEQFEEDGSVSVKYIKTHEDGSAFEVSVKKDVTESSVMVFSDVPIKAFKKGGLFFYLRDILPVILINAVYYVGFELFLSYSASVLGNANIYSYSSLLTLAAFFGIFCIIFNCVTYVMLKENRTMFRISLIQFGAPVTALHLMYFFTRLFAGWGILTVFSKILLTPLPAICFGTMLYGLCVRRFITK